MAGSSSWMTSRRASPERVPRLGPATRTSKGPSSVSTSPTEPTLVQRVTSGRGRSSSATPRTWSVRASARSRTRILGFLITEPR